MDPDDHPTPRISGPYCLADLAREIEVRSKDLAFVKRKHWLMLDLKGSSECEVIAQRCGDLAKRFLCWPHLSDNVIEAERADMISELSQLRDRFLRLYDSTYLTPP